MSLSESRPSLPEPDAGDGRPMDVAETGVVAGLIVAKIAVVDGVAPTVVISPRASLLLLAAWFSGETEEVIVVSCMLEIQGR